MMEVSPQSLPDRAARFTRSQRRIQAAFDLQEPSEPPVMVWPFHYIVFGTDPDAVPLDLFDDPARLTEFQVKWCEQHLNALDDDFQPYLTPYYGTGVLASGFGCQMYFEHGRDPSVAGPCIHSPEDVARLRLPDPQRDGLMPRVLETAAYMRAQGPYPVSLTDSQSPLDELILMCGHERLYLWMYDRPDLVHALMEMVTEAFIQWVRAQKQVTGEPWNECYGEQGVWIPPGTGVWIADDEAVNLSPDLYARYVAPYYPRIFEAFGSGVLHFCGDGSHHGPALLGMQGLRAINSGPMSRPAAFARLQKAVGHKIPLIYQEMSPAEPEPYYQALLQGISPRGVVFAPQVTDRTAITLGGGFVEVRQNRVQAARRVYAALQQALAEKQVNG
jgi:hypothetical protein